MSKRILHLQYKPPAKIKKHTFFTPRIHHQIISSRKLYGFHTDTVLLEFHFPIKRKADKVIKRIQNICYEYEADYITIDFEICQGLDLFSPALPTKFVSNVFYSLRGVDSCVIIDDENGMTDVRDVAKNILCNLNALTVITTDIERWSRLGDFAFEEYGLAVNLIPFESEFVFLFGSRGGSCVLDFSASWLYNNTGLLHNLHEGFLYIDFTLMGHNDKANMLKSLRNDVKYISIYDIFNGEDISR